MMPFRFIIEIVEEINKNKVTCDLRSIGSKNPATVEMLHSSHCPILSFVFACAGKEEGGGVVLNSKFVSLQNKITIILP